MPHLYPYNSRFPYTLYCMPLPPHISRTLSGSRRHNDVNVLLCIAINDLVPKMKGSGVIFGLVYEKLLASILGIF